MFRLFITLLSFVPLLALSAAHAQQSMPSGQQLIKQSQSALKSVRGFHQQDTVVEHVGKQATIRSTVTADISLKHDRAKSTTASHGPTGTVTVQEIMVGKEVAAKTNTGAWHCTSLNSIKQFAGSLIGHPKMQSSRTLGSGAVGGAAVWRVRSTVTIALLGQPETFQETYFIAKSNHRPLQETAHPSVRVNKEQIHESIKSTYSHFGEDVTASLPSSCRK